MAAETDDAFRQLNDAELAALGPLGVRRAVSAGEYLYREGDAGYDTPHTRSRDGRGRWPSRIQLEDRKLSGVSDWHFRWGSDAAGHGSGAKVRRIF